MTPDSYPTGRLGLGTFRAVVRQAAADLIQSSAPVKVNLRTGATGATAVLAATVIVLARQRGVGALNTMWAEDGTIFLAQARVLGLARSMFEPYAGYMHAVPRLAAAAVSALPLAKADTGFALFSGLFTGACALFVYRASSAHVRTRWARVACSAALVLAPLGSSEILASVANLHWYLLYVAFWAMLWRAPSRWEAALAVVIVVASMLSDPFTMLLLPLVWLRVVATGPRDAVVVGFALAGVTQVAIAAGAGDQRELGAASEVVLLPARYAVDVVGRGLVGDRFVGPSGLSLRGVAMAVVALACLMFLAATFRRAARARASLLAGLVGVSAVYFAAPVVLSGISAPRYAFAPSLMLVAAISVVLDGADLRGLAQARSIAPLGLVLAACWAVGLPSTNGRDAGPAWDASLAAAASRCVAGQVVEDVDVSPSGWSMLLPCADLADGTRP